MSKNRKSIKARPAISAEGWSWLAMNLNTDDWNRILDLQRISIDAVLSFVRARMAPASYSQFEELSLPADVVAERRRAEAAKREAEEVASKTIFMDAPREELLSTMPTGEKIINPGRWRPAGLTEKERLAAQELARLDGERIIEIPEAIF